MTGSLYALGVPTFLQTLRAVERFVGLAIDHFVAAGTDPDAVVTARLYPDMAPLHFQVEALTHHAVWGMEAVRTGAFTPPPLIGAMPLADLRALVAAAVEALEALDPASIDRLSGKAFEIDVWRPADEAHPTIGPWVPRRLAFTAETYLLSYALPNVHFHAVTAYAILRANGVPLGKRHYEGELRGRPVT